MHEASVDECLEKCALQLRISDISGRSQRLKSNRLNWPQQKAWPIQWLHTASPSQGLMWCRLTMHEMDNALPACSGSPSQLDFLFCTGKSAYELHCIECALEGLPQLSYPRAWRGQGTIRGPSLGLVQTQSRRRLFMAQHLLSQELPVTSLSIWQKVIQPNNFLPKYVLYFTRECIRQSYCHGYFPLSFCK